MIWQLFKRASSECLGVDIGTSLIKVVEVGKKGKDRELRNYGEVDVKDFLLDSKRSITDAESETIADSIRTILSEAKIKTKTAVFSLPDYYSFFTTFTLPAMTEEEIPEAIRYEAPLYIPLPLSGVTLDWQVVEGLKGKEKESLRILLVAVPTEIVQRYQEIASLAGLKLISLEAEVFGLIRSLVKTDQTVALIDIGSASTTCSIVKEKILRVSHSFDMGGKRLTEELVANLDVETEKAEALKIKNGILGEEKIRKVLTPYLDKILEEVGVAFDNFSRQEKGEVQNLILAGGTVLLPGLKDYFSQKLGLKIEIADPFSGLIFPQVLGETLGKMGPCYATTVGMALRELK